MLVLCESFMNARQEYLRIRHSTPGTGTGFSALMHETSKPKAETKTYLAKQHHCRVHNGKLNIWKLRLINSNSDNEYVNWSSVRADGDDVFPLRTLLLLACGSCDLAVREQGVHSWSYGCLRTEARTLFNYILTLALQMIKSHRAHASALRAVELSRLSGLLTKQPRTLYWALSFGS